MNDLAFGNDVLIPYRASWPFCEGGSGRVWSVPFNRHCEEHVRSQVEPTLWFVSYLLFKELLVVVGKGGLLPDTELDHLSGSVVYTDS